MARGPVRRLRLWGGGLVVLLPKAVWSVWRFRSLWSGRWGMSGGGKRHGSALQDEAVHRPQAVELVWTDARHVGLIPGGNAPERCAIEHERRTDVQTQHSLN